ncbi:MAG: RsiV family protein [Lachnospiraceae bacterium]|nr:RsiV family protein [Lachnospiraceae bacterium]
MNKHMENNDLKELEKRLLEEKKHYQAIPVPEELKGKLEEATKAPGKVHRFRIPAVVAAAVVLLVLLPNTGADIAYAMGNIPLIGKLFQAVTFRDYRYESERFDANVEVPQIIVEDMGETDEETEDDSMQLQETIEQVNFDIEEVTNQLIEEFKVSAELGESYGSLEIHHETVTDNEQYFTLKLSIYQGAGSGSESYKFYTIDKKSGKQIQIVDLFQENSGYEDVISEDIRNQMRTAMAEDEMNMYWVDNTDMPDINWEGIKEDQNFYFDGKGNIVFIFDEYEVAPGYMGAQEFMVERSVFENLLK